jgi:dienelactone hydrolase
MKNKFLFLIVTLLPLVMNAQLKEVAYNDGEQKLSGFSIKSKVEKKKKPGVLILPAWMGIDNHAKESATQLAELGYYAFVADIYGVGNKPTNFKEAGEKAGYYKKNILDYQRRIQLALNELVKEGANPNEIFVIGYCFGGTGAIEAARSNMKVKGIVSFHGGLGKDQTRPNTAIEPKVLVLHGADDPYVSKEEIEAFQSEMRVAKSDWQMIYYANAVHAFTDKNVGNDNSKGAAYNELADKRSWKAMLDFFTDVF